MHPYIHAQKFPDKPAYIMAGSGETVTYRQLDDQSNRIAQLFRALGAAVPAFAHLPLLVDAQGREADEGVLWQRTPANMRGYLNMPEKTRDVLTADGWYISGDVFRRDKDGAYYFVGRTDDMFVCGGENIFPIEVVSLLERHPAVHQAVVLPFAHELKGQVPYAFVVLRPGQQATEQALKEYALEHGPAFQHPRRVFFLERMPLAGTNKIDQAALRKLAAQTPPANTPEKAHHG